jgi:hypothetical protein
MVRSFPGTADNKVDWKYDMEFIKEKFQRIIAGYSKGRVRN